MNASEPIAACWPHLNATSAADAEFFTEAELYRYADEELQRWARTGPVFVEAASINLIAAQGRYSLPARHQATVDATALGRALRQAGVAELFAGDELWATRTAAQPEYYAQDEIGLGGVTLYPAPLDAATNGLRLVYAQAPAEVTSGSPTVTCPDALKDGLMFAALAGARAKETPGAQPDVAEWCAGVAGMYRQLVSEVWG